MSTTVLRPLAPPGAPSSTPLRPTTGARKPPSAMSTQRARLTSFGAPGGLAPPGPTTASMLYSNGHQTAPAQPQPAEPKAQGPVPDQKAAADTEPLHRPSAAEEHAELAELQAQLIGHEYGTVGLSEPEARPVTPPKPKKNELFDAIVAEDQNKSKDTQIVALPRRSTTESLVTLGASFRDSKKRSGSEDELHVSPGPIRRGRTPPPSDFINMLSRDRRGVTARRVRTVTRTNIALPYDTLLTNPVLQQVYEPEDIRFARLEYLVETRHKTHVLWFNNDAIEHLSALKASMQKRRRSGDQLVVGHERDMYEEEISLRALSGDAEEDQHSSDDSPSRSLVKRFARSTNLYSSTDSTAANGSDNRPTRSLSSSTIMAPVAAAAGSSSGLAKTTSSPHVPSVGRPGMSRSAGSLPVGVEIDMQGSATDPIVPEPLIRGLHKLRAELEVMLVHQTAARTAALYTSGNPPRRTLYVQSKRGSGVYTLVKSMCYTRKFNLIRIHLASDITFTEDMYIHIIDFARLIQPCVVLFDRCDFWFRPESYPMRGEKFVISHCGYPSLPEEEVFFIFSGDTPLPSTHLGFREFISYRHIVESDITLEERTSCFLSVFEAWIGQMRHAGTDAVPEGIDKIIADYLPGLQEACREFADKWEMFTPGMIKVFCDRVIEVARTRANNEALPLPDQPIYIYAAFPIESDFTFVESLIETTTPGRIVWKTY